MVGSPRGGTSVLKQVLASSPNVVALHGEHRWLLTLHRLCFPDVGTGGE